MAFYGDCSLRILFAEKFNTFVYLYFTGHAFSGLQFEIRMTMVQPLK